MSRFNNGRAVVVISGESKLIDERGTVLTQRHYDRITIADGGVIIVSRDGAIEDDVYRKGLIGVIDRDGREIVPAKFKSITPLDPGLFIATEDLFSPPTPYGIVGEGGRWTITPRYREPREFSKGGHRYFWAISSCCRG